MTTQPPGRRRLAALEALAFSPRADASHANLAAELHVLAAASLSENDVAEMLRRLEGGRASDCDRARRLGRCSLSTLRTVARLCATV